MTDIQKIADMMDDSEEDAFIEDEGCSPYKIVQAAYPGAGDVDHRAIHDDGLLLAYKKTVNNMGYCNDEHIRENWLANHDVNFDVQEMFIFILLEHIGYWQNTSGSMTPAVSANYYRVDKDILVDEEYEHLISEAVIRYLRRYKYEVKYV